MSTERAIKEALDIANRYGSLDGSDHKAWGDRSNGTSKIAL